VFGGITLGGVGVQARGVEGGGFHAGHGGGGRGHTACERVSGDFELEPGLLLQQARGIHGPVVVIGSPPQALGNIVSQKIFGRAFAFAARRGRVDDHAGRALEHQHGLGILTEDRFVREVNFGAITGFIRVQHLVDLLLAQLGRQRLQLLGVFAGAGPTCRRLAFAAGGFVDVFSQAGHPLSVIAGRELVRLSGLTRAAQIRQQLVLGFALGADLFFGRFGHDALPSADALAHRNP
jgi:hypothetical protein